MPFHAFKVVLISAFRSLQKNRLFTLLNVVGLAIGISACWTTWLIVRYEFSYESGIPDSERIYRVVSNFVIDGQKSGNAGAPKPMAQMLRTEVPGVELSVPVWETWTQKVAVPQGAGLAPLVFEEADQQRIISTTHQCFQLIPFQWLSGSPANFEAKGKVVLTQKRAATYFPNYTPEQVLGRQIIYRDTVMATVAGVVANWDFPTDFGSEEFVTMGTLRKETVDDNAWGGVNSGDQVFLKVAPDADVPAMAAGMNRISQTRSAKIMEKWGNNLSRAHVLQPLRDIHFGVEYRDNHRKADKKVLYGLLGIAAFLLLLACINFINLATAQMPARSRELGIRKALGSGKAALIGQFLSETFFTSLLAAGMGYGLVRLFAKYFKELIPEGMEIHAHLGMTLLFLLGLLVLISLLAGLYPGWLATKVQPSKILRGEPVFTFGGGRITLRKSLIVFQFAIAQLFMLSALVMGSQLRYSLNHDLGFHRDAVLTISVPFKFQQQEADHDRRFTLCNEWRALPSVSALSLGEAPVSFSFSSNTHVYHGKNGDVEANVYRKMADTTYLNFYKMPLLAGRNLSRSDESAEYVINETCARTFGFAQPQDAIGAYLTERDDAAKPVQIVGVVRDFHTASFTEKIQPLAIVGGKDQLYDFNIQLASARPSDWPAAIAALGKVWEKFYPGEKFEPDFYDATLERVYESERLMARLINMVTLVAILISCLGLFGLVTLTAFQRTKEIGIRKVLGASVAGITGLLAKDFLKLVLLAIVIASPIAWYFMQTWLADFAYRIDIQWWMFALAGAAAVLIAFVTVGFQAVKAALANPVKSLRSE
jgi:predicted permease